MELNCFLTGIPDPQVQWKKDDVTISETSATINNFTNAQGVHVAVLRFESATVEDNGNYTCAATNIAGSAEFTFTVDRIRTAGK